MPEPCPYDEVAEAEVSPKASSLSFLEMLLPENILLDEILPFLWYSEKRRLLGGSKTLWSYRVRMDRCLSYLTFARPEGLEHIRNQPFQSETRLRHMFGCELSSTLLSLTLDYCANDGFLHVALVELGLFPNLQAIRMRSCHQITDFGLDCLSRSAAAKSFQSIDITFCRHTTYAGTFVLRERVPHLRVLRRQPEWLDGKFETPFSGNNNGNGNGNGNDGEQSGCTGGEIHTYYADGSFQFNRNSQSNGFVCQLYPWDEDFLGDKLQYNNFRAPLGWPEWTQFCYRPGVCLLRVPDDEQDSESRGSTVLVGQYMRGLRAPQSRSLMEKAKDLVPLGKSRYFDKTIEELLPYQDAASVGEHYSHQWDHVIMISRMRVQPLPADQLMPPPELVRACQNTCRGMQSYGRDFLILQEERLNQLLSGEDAL